MGSIEDLEQERRKRRRGGGGADDGPAIDVSPGRLADAVAAAMAALAAETDPFAAIYRRGSILVRAVRLPSNQNSGGLRRAAGALSLIPVDADWLALRLAQLTRCFCVKADGLTKKNVDPSAALCRSILAAAPWPDFPELTGVIEAPTITPTGLVVQKAGYDPATGLLFNPGAATFPAIPDRPTRAQAMDALQTLLEPFVDFPFEDGAARAVAVSAVLTALVRRTLRAAPLIGFDAPKMASGKTLLATVASYIASGRAPAMLSQADDPTDERKRLLSVLLENAAIVVIDNIERPLRSDSLCSILTEPVFSDRLLGASKTVAVPTNVSFFATGNNLTLGGDLSARAIVCRLDPQCERPETREFARDLHRWVPDHRGALAAAVITIAAGYIAAGAPRPPVPVFGRFEEWSRLCRDPLVWLGLGDPCSTREKIEASDPVREALTVLLSAWREHFLDQPARVTDAVNVQTGPLREACENVATDRGSVSPKRLGWFIKRHVGRIEGGMRFVQAGKARGGALWLVEAVQP